MTSPKTSTTKNGSAKTVSECRCGKDHTGHEELDPQKVIERLAQQMADDIDREILDQIRKAGEDRELRRMESKGR